VYKNEIQLAMIGLLIDRACSIYLNVRWKGSASVILFCLCSVYLYTLLNGSTGKDPQW